MKGEADGIILCSDCFADEGLRIGALALGSEDSDPCPNCGKKTGRKLSRAAAGGLAYSFFTWGSRQRATFGGAPLIVSNQVRKSDIRLAHWSGNDLALFEEKLGLGFFLYGPRLWMLGEIEPLKNLQKVDSRAAIIDRILAEYPSRVLEPPTRIYRLRRGPGDPADQFEYDSPPKEFLGEGRLESPELPVFYGSQDIETCIHECRLTVLDDSFLATVAPTADLRLLDLTHLLREEHVSEFESLDMAVHMLFLAAAHSYPITREIARYARTAGFDGIIYPSFFSLARIGAEPFPTIMGISIRRIPQFAQSIRNGTIPNVALFGYPIREGKVRVLSVNRLVLARVSYGVVLGPVGVTEIPDADRSIAPMPEADADAAPGPVPEALDSAMSLITDDLNRQFASGRVRDEVAAVIEKVEGHKSTSSSCELQTTEENINRRESSASEDQQ